MGENEMFVFDCSWTHQQCSLIWAPFLLQEDASTLKACGVTASKTILVLGAVKDEQQKQLAGQEQQAQQVQQRADRLDRLRKAAKALAQRSGSRHSSQTALLCVLSASVLEGGFTECNNASATLSIRHSRY